MNSQDLREKIVESLVEQGFIVNQETGSLCPAKRDKEAIRALHEAAHQHKLNENQKFLEANAPKCAKFFANGRDLDLKKFDPYVIPITKNSKYESVYRLATLLWSVPVSNGYGRRQRFIVLDRSNDKLVGIFALGDPVYNQKTRDEYIGWKNQDRRTKLYNMMDLFVAGAVPPYSNLLCGKLMAMLAVTNETRTIISEKYRRVQGTGHAVEDSAQLVAITTSSALGRSSQYSRICYADKKIYLPIGFSQGWGHFHMTNGLYAEIIKFLEDGNFAVVKKNRFGDGPNWKFRVLRVAFEALGLSPDFLCHGVQRQQYIAPLAKNYKEYFSMQSVCPEFTSYPSSEIIQYFIGRWFLPRSERVSDYAGITVESTLRKLLARVGHHVII